VDLYGREPPAELALMYINRIKTGGRPRFRTYPCQEPLELLAYVENGEVAHQSDVDRITEIVRNVAQPGQGADQSQRS
jgi:hypothetical protein